MRTYRSVLQGAHEILRPVLDQEVAFGILKLPNGPELSDENFPSINSEFFWPDISMEMIILVDLA